jgi:hypothetical protein
MTTKFTHTPEAIQMAENMLTVGELGPCIIIRNEATRAASIRSGKKIISTTISEWKALLNEQTDERIKKFIVSQIDRLEAII